MLRRMRLLREKRGFTLPEMLVATTVALIAGAGAVTFVRSQSLAMKTQAGQADLNDSSRGAIEFMAREIRQAGYWPCGSGAAGTCTVGACAFNAACAGNTRWTGVVAGATSTLLRVQADLDGNGAISTAAADSEDLTYQYDAANLKVTRTAGSGAGAVTSDVVTDIPAGAFQFRYWDDSAPPQLIAPGVGGLTACQASAVKRVEITVQPSKVPDARTTTQAKASLDTNVFLVNYGKCQ